MTGLTGSELGGDALLFRPIWVGVGNTLGVLLALAVLQTPLQGLLAWFDGLLADRLDPGAP